MKQRLFPSLAALVFLGIVACGTPVYTRYDSYGGYCRDPFGSWSVCPGYYYDPGLHVIINRHTYQPVYASSRYAGTITTTATGVPPPSSLAPRGTITTTAVKASPTYQTYKTTGSTTTTSGTTNTTVSVPKTTCSGQSSCTGVGNAITNKSGGGGVSQSSNSNVTTTKPVTQGASQPVSGPVKPSGPVPPVSAPRPVSPTKH